jgi:hypothetical protein
MPTVLPMLRLIFGLALLVCLGMMHGPLTHLSAGESGCPPNEEYCVETPAFWEGCNTTYCYSDREFCCIMPD